MRTIIQMVQQEVINNCNELVSYLFENEHESTELLYGNYTDCGYGEEYLNEPLEYWIVSDWLASKLEQKNECIARDVLGFNIWGRTTSGQSISIDRVIEDIYTNSVRRQAAILECPQLASYATGEVKTIEPVNSDRPIDNY